MNEGTISLYILHTNDLHSSFEAMPRIHSIIQHYIDTVPPERLLRFDIGDHMDRMHPLTEGTLGIANIEVMNAAGYDAAVPGNNEGLTFPLETVERFYSKARFPLLASNLVESTKEKHPVWLAPHVVLERSGFRIGVIGATAPFDSFYRELGLRALDPLSSIEAEVAHLRKRERVDVVIVLSHLGLSTDKRLAAEIDGIDLILGGHTHHTLPELLSVEGTMIGAAGKLGAYVGVVELAMDPETRRPVFIRGTLEDTNHAPPSPVILKLMEEQTAASRTSLDQVVAVLSERLEGSEEEESPLGNLLAGALRRACGAEIGLVNAGQVLGGLEAGPVTVERLLSIFPSPINPCTVTILGRDLQRALEESLLPEFRSRPIRGYGFRGNQLGSLCVAGMTLQYEPTAAPGSKIRQIVVNGKPFQPDRSYIVGTIDMFTFRIGYETLADVTSVKYHLPSFIRDLLADALRDTHRRQKWIAEAKLRNWKKIVE